ncbi:transcriptional regulator [Psychrobacillus sp. FSL K6-2684]|uniref:transcriptional regulator n=1 Tax=unclassified Psychrobacillus TaxID=2636677 RepID=UPI001244E952|nr:transcriptional regulator [Psychrobacillus sp. AK 1817]QEY22052.1 transcriptional regulator [Psychrobacillus sp. AK 1817]
MRILVLKALKYHQLVEMIYIKDNGEISKRRIKVISIKADSFQAYCYLRKKKRTFKMNNILAFVPLTEKEKYVI